MKRLTSLLACLAIVEGFALVFAVPVSGGEHRLQSPDAKLSVIISDQGGLKFRVLVDGQPVVSDSPLGLEFQDGSVLGPRAEIVSVKRDRHRGSWENRFGQRWTVRDDWQELRINVREAGTNARSFALVVRAYDEGVAFRYDLPTDSGLENFVVTRELTEFRFTDNHACWAGGESSSSETTYPQRRLSEIPAVTGDKARAGQPYRGVLPLLVQTPAAYVAIAESDLRNWAGMFVSGSGSNAVRVTLAPRTDGRGAVVGTAPMTSPWRVLMIGRRAADLVGSDLIATLATPNQIGDDSWVRPGIAAWDVWWTGENPSLPQFTGLDARGDTRSHKEYIDFAAEVGWPYQIVDWFWYEHMTSYTKNLLSQPNSPSGDFTRSVPAIDVPELVRYAGERKVRLWIWAHSLDVETFGVERALEHFARLGVVGLKVDFIDSDSQQAVQWCERLLAAAAKHRLMIDLHGMYKPTGLARTYPNFVTQEGVLGNEYNKFGRGECNLKHTVTLPFTRGLLGPMDFTPGGFLNRTPKEFKITHPAQVMGTRARQLAMTVIYRSPLLVLCDSPANYRGQAGVKFFRDLPTVWDETVVLEAEVGQRIAIARRSGDRWYLAAMNGETTATIKLPLKFLGNGNWTMRRFADLVGGQPTDVVETTESVSAKSVVTVELAAGGGFTACLTATKEH